MDALTVLSLNTRHWIVIPLSHIVILLKTLSGAIRMEPTPSSSRYRITMLLQVPLSSCMILQLLLSSGSNGSTAESSGLSIYTAVLSIP